MKLSKLLFITLLCITNLDNLVAQGPCDFDVKYTVSQAGNGHYQISLQAQGNGAFFNLKLYDLYTGEVIEEKQVQLTGNNEKVAFSDVKPSQYVIYISSQSCPKQRTIGGIEGIKVGN